VTEIQTIAVPQARLGSGSQYHSENYLDCFNRFFGFSESPFNNTPDPNFFFMSQHHHEALTSLNFGIYQRRGFLVLTGEVGAGKTTLCRQFLAQLSPEIKTAVILNSRVSGTHLLSSVVQDFGIIPRGKGRRGLYEALAAFLLDGINRNQNACLIIDEAQCLNLRVLEEIRLLSNLETSKQKLIQIVLMGQPELRDLLKKPSLRQLRQRIGVYVHLRGFTPNETRDYILHRLSCVSRGESKIAISTDVFERIHEATRGTPRLINTACDRILMAAYAHQTSHITLDVARDAFEEISFICAQEKGEGGSR